MEEGRQASVVRWNTSIANCAHTGLAACLEWISGQRAAKRKRASANVSPDEGRDGADNRRPLVTVLEVRSCDTQSTVLHYILDGRAGKMEATSNGLFMLRKLQNNFLPVDGNENVVADGRTTSLHCTGRVNVGSRSAARPTQATTSPD